MNYLLIMPLENKDSQLLGQDSFSQCHRNNIEKKNGWQAVVEMPLHWPGTRKRLHELNDYFFNNIAILAIAVEIPKKSSSKK